MEPARRIPFQILFKATGGFPAAARIGEGATGEVFRGMLDGVPVAIKCLKLPEGAAAAGRTDLGRRFYAEFEVLARYRHPRIVRMLGYAEDDAPTASSPYALVFELLEGGSLADWLIGSNGESPLRGDGGRICVLSAHFRLNVALGVAAGLAFLHGQREAGEGEGSPTQPVLHRDVKSANVGLTSAQPDDATCFAKVLDCGLAKALRGGTPGVVAAGASFTGGLAAGTVGYMPPELASGMYTVASEVYAFGVMLLELLLGQRVGPRTAVEVEEAAEDYGVGTLVARADPAWPKPAAEALAALVFDCIRIRPAKRPQSMAAVTVRLQLTRAHINTAPVLVACGICYEEVPATTGVRCSGGHFVCRGCLQGVVEMNLEARRLAASGGAFPCPQPKCESEPWSIEALDAHLDNGTLVKYGAALRYQLFDAAKSKRETEAALAAKEAAAK